MVHERSERVDSLIPLMHTDQNDPELICLINKDKNTQMYLIHFEDFRIQFWITQRNAP